jgi:hypothetical protein
MMMVTGGCTPRAYMCALRFTSNAVLLTSSPTKMTDVSHKFPCVALSSVPWSVEVSLLLTTCTSRSLSQRLLPGTDISSRKLPPPFTNNTHWLLLIRSTFAARRLHCALTEESSGSGAPLQLPCKQRAPLSRCHFNSNVM